MESCRVQLEASILPGVKAAAYDDCMSTICRVAAKSILLNSLFSCFSDCFRANIGHTIKIHLRIKFNKKFPSGNRINCH